MLYNAYIIINKIWSMYNIFLYYVHNFMYNKRLTQCFVHYVPSDTWHLGRPLWLSRWRRLIQTSEPCTDLHLILIIFQPIFFRTKYFSTRFSCKYVISRFTTIRSKPLSILNLKYRTYNSYLIRESF